MKRIRYIKSNKEQTLQSKLLYETPFHTKCRIFLTPFTFYIEDMTCGELLAQGDSKNPVYLKKLAKQALIRLVGNMFEQETREQQVNTEQANDVC